MSTYRVMSEEDRGAFVDALRRLADFYDAHPAFPVPYDVRVFVNGGGYPGNWDAFVAEFPDAELAGARAPRRRPHRCQGAAPGGEDRRVRSARGRGRAHHRTWGGGVVTRRHDLDGSPLRADGTYPCCGGYGEHFDHCPAQAVLAEAERLVDRSAS